jgi:hypothetical protein
MHPWAFDPVPLWWVTKTMLRLENILKSGFEKYFTAWIHTEAALG